MAECPYPYHWRTYITRRNISIKVKSRDQLLEDFFAERGRVRAEAEKSLMEKKEQKARYQSMIDKVQDWEPPTEGHVRLKDFMLKVVTNGNNNYLIF